VYSTVNILFSFHHRRQLRSIPGLLSRHPERTSGPDKPTRPSQPWRINNINASLPLSVVHIFNAIFKLPLSFSSHSFLSLPCLLNAQRRLLIRRTPSTRFNSSPLPSVSQPTNGRRHFRHRASPPSFAPHSDAVVSVSIVRAIHRATDSPSSLHTVAAANVVYDSLLIQ
jgi:hypothetical protein